jgi:hypothetical protein
MMYLHEALQFFMMLSTFSITGLWLVSAALLLAMHYSMHRKVSGYIAAGVAAAHSLLSASVCDSPAATALMLSGRITSTGT